MDVETEIKTQLASAKTNVFALEKKMGMTRNTIQNMLKRGSLRYDMAQTIAKAIGKRIVWVDVD